MLDALIEQGKKVYDLYISGGVVPPESVMTAIVILEKMDEALKSGDEKKYNWLLDRLTEVPQMVMIA